MQVTELKSNIHQIVNSIHNEQVLQTLYDFLKLKENETDNSIWESLDEDQREEVLLAYEESENPENLK